MHFYFKKIKSKSIQGTLSRKISCVHVLEELLLLKYLFYPKWPIHLMESLLNSNSILHRTSKQQF